MKIRPICPDKLRRQIRHNCTGNGQVVSLKDSWKLRRMSVQLECPHFGVADLDLEGSSVTALLATSPRDREYRESN